MLAFSAQAARFNAGEDYQVLNLPATEKPTVTEFFSFFCPHCYQQDPFFQALKKQLPENATFEKKHVSFMGGKMGPAVSRAYATMVLLGVQDKMSPVLFNRIHVQNNAPRSEADIRQMFIDEGVSAEEFDGTFNSFAAKSMASRFDKAFSDAGLQGVPAVIVNGKYYVTPKTIKTAEDYFALVNYLLTQK